MKISDMIPSKYLKQSDVEEPMKVTIQAVKKVNVAKDDETPEFRWTIKFNEFDKPMVCNSTNLKRLALALGDESDDWIGNQVVLYVDAEVEFGGKITGGLRLRGLKQSKAPTKPTQIDDDETLPF